MLHRLYPTPGPVEDSLDLVLGEERSRPDRPWVMLNFVTSIDGATAVGGRSTPLNDEDDKMLFGALRAAADVIVVGAGTVAAESYGPVRLDEERRNRRVERGRSPVPVLAIVSGTLSVDPEARVFSDSDYKPMIITGPEANPGKLALIGDAADVVILEEVTAPAIVAHLGAVGVLLCEGGPTLAGQFVAAGLVDEIDLTKAPLVVGGESKRLVHGVVAEPPMEMRLDRVLVGDRSVFLRYLRA